MALNPKLMVLAGNKIRLEWTPDLTGQGYRLYVDGVAVSRTFKPDAKSTTFSVPDAEPHRYGVQKMDVVETLEEVTHPEPPAPPPSALPFSEPVLTNPVLVTNVPSRYSQDAVDADYIIPGDGRDYLIDLGRNPRHGLVLRSNGRVGNVKIVNGHFDCSCPRSQSDFRRGGLRMEIKGKHIGITDLYVNGGPTMTDALTLACAYITKVTLQRSYLGGHPNLDEVSAHPDMIQVQGAIGALEIGLVTGYVSGEVGHGGKGLHVDIISTTHGEVGGPYPVTMREVDINSLGDPSTGAKSVMRIGNAKHGQIRFDVQDVFMAEGPGGTMTPITTWVTNYFADSSHAPTISGTKPNRTIEFRNPATGYAGVFRECPYGEHFVTPAMLGY